MVDSTLCWGLMRAMDGMPAKGRPRRSRLRLALVAFLLLIVALEVALQVCGVLEPRPIQAAQANGNDWAVVLEESDEPRLSYVNAPGIDVTIGGVSYRHDERGRRVPSSPLSVPDPGAPTVVFLGDSTTYGLGLNAREGLVEQTAAQLGGLIRPANLGVCGYNTAQEVALYGAERAHLPGAEVVVLVVFPNDFAPVPSHWDGARGILYFDPFPLARPVRHLLWESALYRAVVTVVIRLKEALGDGGYGFTPRLTAMANNISRLHDLTRQDGRQLLVAHLPAMAPLDPYVFQAAERDLQAICAAEGVAYVDLLEGFLMERKKHLRRYERSRGEALNAAGSASLLSMYWLKYPTDQHLNAAANRVAAGPLAQAIGGMLRRVP